MKAIYIIVVLLCRFLSVFSSSCTVNPSQLQCLAANNRFLIPRKSDCDPFKNECRMGDLVKSSIAGWFSVGCFLLFSVPNSSLVPSSRGWGDLYKAQLNCNHPPPPTFRLCSAV